MKKKLTKEQWIQAAYMELVRRLCVPSEPLPANHAKNLRDCAETLAEEESGFFQDGYTPEEAVYEEIQAGL